jgi:hypothetical protein
VRELVGHLSVTSSNQSDHAQGNGLLGTRDTESAVDSVAGQPENAEEMSCEGSSLRFTTVSVLVRL